MAEKLAVVALLWFVWVCFVGFYRHFLVCQVPYVKYLLGPRDIDYDVPGCIILTLLSVLDESILWIRPGWNLRS